MKRLFQVFAFAVALCGCAKPPARTQPFARAGKLNAVSEADIVAAVAAAEHSELSPGRPVAEVQVVSSSEIDVYYNPPKEEGGFLVIVKRGHERWKAEFASAWSHPDGLTTRSSERAGR